MKTISATFIALACAAVSFWFFYTDLNMALFKNEEPVAYVRLKDRIVQRHFINRRIWDRLQNGTPVYHGDIVRTDNASDVSIVFKNGNACDLGENSMVQIYDTDEGTVVEAAYGIVRLSAGSGAGIILTSGTGTLQLNEGGEVIASISPNKNGEWTEDAAMEDSSIAVNVVSGRANLTNGEGVEQIVNAGEITGTGGGKGVKEEDKQELEKRATTLPPSDTTEIQQVEDQQTADDTPQSAEEIIVPPVAGISQAAAPSTTPPLPVKLLSPPDKTSWIEGSAPPVFDWQNDGSFINVRLVISGDKDMEIQDKNDAVYAISALKAGSYRWTVHASDASGEDAGAVETRSFTIKERPPFAAPRITTPAANTVIDREMLIKNQDVNVLWNAVQGANAYIVTVWKDSQESAPILTGEPQTGRQYTIKNIALLCNAANENGESFTNFIVQVEAIHTNKDRTIDRRGYVSRRTFSVNITALNTPEVLQ